MASELTVVRAGQTFPEAWSASLYLCGPTSLDPRASSWRDEALRWIGEHRYDEGRLVVFLPEAEAGRTLSYADQIAWEEAAMRMSDVILFFVPRAMPSLPGLVTNVKWGAWHRSGRAVLGSPPEAERNAYLLHFAQELSVPVSGSLEGTVCEALRRLGAGAHRTGGERWVPLHLWSTPAFQRWYAGETAAGRSLRLAEVLWSDGHPAQQWALRVELTEPARAGLVRSTVVVRGAECDVLD